MLMSMKRDARKLQPIVQEELRRRAVAAIHGGMRQVEAAEVFGGAHPVGVDAKPAGLSELPPG